MPAVRLVIADDQRLVRAGLRVILDRDPDLQVVGEAANGAEAVELAARLRPDVVLMDIQMPVLDGVAATRSIVAAASAAVLVLTTFDADEYVYQALRAGASGFLLKDVPEEQLLEGVRIVAAGEAMLSPAVTRRLIAEFSRAVPATPTSPGPALSALTAREVDVLREVARGRSNAEIAGDLVVSLHTVKTHVARTLAKLGLRDRTQLVVMAYETGLVARGEQ